MGRRGRFEAWKVIVIARREREREEIIEVLINDATWRRSWRDGHLMTLNRGDWWCSDEKIVLGTRMRDWSWGGWVG
jgi:hypothetical protein